MASSTVHSDDLHNLFRNLTGVLDSLPANSGSSAPFDLRDDSVSLLHAMDRVLGTGADFESSDVSSESGDEEEPKVCYCHRMELFLHSLAA